MLHKKHGFTLIELLVVISIIAVLMSIMMPALGKARENAKNVICRTNLKSQITPQFMYAGDNNGNFVGHTDNSPEYFRSAGSPNSNVHKLMNESYIEDSQIFICPVIKSFGGYFADTKAGKPAGGSSWGGGWDSPTKGDGYYDVNPQHILTAYMWMANFRQNTSAKNDKDNPRVKYNYVSTQRNKRISAAPWPNKMDECSSKSPFIAHRVTYTPGSFFRDLSHGGKDAYINDSTFTSAKSTDTPVCYGDGSIVMRKKSEMESGGKAEALNIEFFF